MAVNYHGICFITLAPVGLATAPPVIDEDQNVLTVCHLPNLGIPRCQSSQQQVRAQLAFEL